MGDALAIALMEARQFQHEDFARFHPGGSLGRKLLVKVKDLMRKENLPFIDKHASFTEMLLCMSEGKLGMVIVGTPTNVAGVITDGDLRRGLVKYNDIHHLPITDLMNTNPKIINEHELVYDAEALMMERKITTLLVHNDDNILTGVYQIFTRLK